MLPSKQNTGITDKNYALAQIFSGAPTFIVFHHNIYNVWHHWHAPLFRSLDRTVC